jgi:hypothetical protein
MNEKTNVRARAMRADIQEQLAGFTAEADRLEAEFARIVIWRDSGFGPSPDRWTDEMWDWYIRSRSATSVA